MTDHGHVSFPEFTAAATACFSDQSNEQAGASSLASDCVNAVPSRKTRDMRAAALWYAANGIPVIPLHTPTLKGCSCGKNPGVVADDTVCRSVGKHPRTATGLKEASTDADQIAKWWKKWPDANIGILTGSVSGILVLDLDFRGEGPADRDEVINGFGLWSGTAEVTTGSGGLHVFFRYPGGRVPAHLAAGVDLKGDGGYVVAPPSLHASGRRYKFNGAEGKQALLNLAPPPEWLQDRIAEGNTGRGKHNDSEMPAATEGKVAPGQRHEHLVSLAGTLRYRGLSERVIEAALLAENSENCNPPKPEAEVRQIAKSISGYAVGRVSAEPQGWPDIIPFVSTPTDLIARRCLPGFLGEMAQALSESTETPLEMAALMTLAVASASVASRADVSPEPGYTEPLNLFVAAAMESGNRKTAVTNTVIAPLLLYEKLQAAMIGPQRKRLSSQRQTVEAQIAGLRRRAASPKGSPTLMDDILRLESELPEIPILPRLIAEDVTPERLASMMSEQGGRIGIFSDEGGIFDTMAGRYSGVPNLDVYLKGHAVSPLRVDRQNPDRPPITIDKPHLTIGISPQPHVLASLSNKPEFRDRGLLARFLFGLPRSPLGHRTLNPSPIPAEISTRYHRGIQALLHLPPDTVLHLVFTLESYATWKAFQRDIESQFLEGGKLENMKDWGSKLPGAAARIAGVLHMVVHAEHLVIPTEIERATVEAAVDIAAALISHCGAAFALMALDEAATNAQKVVKWIIRERSAFFLARDCFRAHQSPFKKMAVTMQALELLVQRGYIRIESQASSGGRRGTDLCEVNPALLRSITQ